MGTRRSINDPAARAQFTRACSILDDMMSGITVGQAATAFRNSVPGLRFVGVDQELSYYDLFALWHVVAMSRPTGAPRQNEAHGGPIFLPWHRHFMILLEQWMQFVLDDQDFGIPYWDWAADGDLPPSMQWRTGMWDGLGPSRGAVTTGDLSTMRVRIWQNPQTGQVHSLRNPRPIEREAGQYRDLWGRGLPTSNSVAVAMQQPAYGQRPWSYDGAGHRPVLEGWNPANPALPVDLHNLVHVWTGGDMAPGTSPNDPVFFLNHCNVDRIWEAWMVDNGRSYSPPAGHRADSAMFTLFTQARTPADVLDASPWYTYDSLQVS